MSIQIPLAVELTDGVGFFSEFFRLSEAALIAKRLGLELRLCCDNWLFKCEKGWSDYFLSVQTPPAEDEKLWYSSKRFDGDAYFTVGDYRHMVRELFLPRIEILERANHIMNRLFKGEPYHAIFIRRGDKVVKESVCLPTSVYVGELLAREPNVKRVFVQTDDYRAVEEVKALLPAGVEVFTTCPKEKFGAWVFDFTTQTEVPYEGNDAYMKSFDTLPQQVCVKDFTPEQKREHVEEMLAGVLACMGAKGCVLDHLSNTGRFIIFAGMNAWPIDKHLTYEEDQHILCPHFFPFMKQME